MKTIFLAMVNINDQRGIKIRNDIEFASYDTLNGSVNHFLFLTKVQD